MTKKLRPEHPEPQMRREAWENLNGEWEFEFDFGNSGEDRKFYQRMELNDRILLPFCPESRLSGIGHLDFIPAVWYRRTLVLKKDLKEDILLHFGAADYWCVVWLNGKKAGEHRGGFSSFVIDITELAVEGENNLVVCVRDDGRSGRQPRGKQSASYQSRLCDYTRTTGIWQTVWLEYVPKSRICQLKYFPNLQEASLTIQALVRGSGRLAAEVFYEGVPCGKASAESRGGNVFLTIPLSELHLWEPGKGELYSLKLTFGRDVVDSYFGMREIRIEGEKVLINGKSVFQRLVLDQGFYPEGIYTAPEDADLERDIRISMEAGFNGARLHQKVFEPRFLYHCDRLGYLVWEEQGNWGLDYSAPESLGIFLPEWMEIMERDFNHPSIIGWCPFNETWDYEGRRQEDSLLRIVWQMTKRFDPTRPCIDTSGNFHVVTDIYDLHDYEQDPEAMEKRYADFKAGGKLPDTFPHRQTPVEGIPVFISEFGGIRWDMGDRGDSWGYGRAPGSEEEFVARYRGLADVLLDNPRISGFCYTQLYDVEQEQNGLYTYGRELNLIWNISAGLTAGKRLWRKKVRYKADRRQRGRTGAGRIRSRIQQDGQEST